ncbi:MAG: GNAT family N-acetyltransferase [Pirellulales bacterium]
MLHFRHFLNGDPPKLVALWQACTQYSGLLRPITVEMLEVQVFNKPYFDHEGLIVAFDEAGLVGFAHAGFGPNDARTDIEHDLGTTALCLIHPRAVENTELIDGLISRSEEYLRARGAKILYGGSILPLNPFYLGLYGGSELPGILESDRLLLSIFQSRGYQEIDRVPVLRRNLLNLKPSIDRRLMQIRRRTQIAVVEEPPVRTWWESWTEGEFERRELQLLDIRMGNQIAGLTLRKLEPPTVSTFHGSYGLVDLWVEEPSRRQGLGSYLLFEAFKYLHDLGVESLEAQTMQSNQTALNFYRKLGFEQVDTGIVLRKIGTTPTTES